MTTRCAVVVIVVVSNIPPATHVEFEIKVKEKNLKKRTKNILKIFSNYMAYHRISMSQSNQIQRCLLSFALNVTILKRSEITKNKNPNLVENLSCVFIRIVNSLIRVLYIFLDLQKIYVCMH